MEYNTCTVTWGLNKAGKIFQERVKLIVTIPTDIVVVDRCEKFRLIPHVSIILTKNTEIFTEMNVSRSLGSSSKQSARSDLGKTKEFWGLY